MSDIAQATGVSVATVSRVLTGGASAIPIGANTRTQVLRVAREMGYRPNVYARSLRTKKSWFIGAIIWDLIDPYFSEILSGVQKALGESEHHLLLDTVESDASKLISAIEWIESVHPAGLLLIGGPRLDASDDRLSQVFSKLPTVLIGTRTEDSSVLSVTVDNFRTGVIGTEYCLSQPERTFRFLTFRDRTEDEEDRLEGTLKVLAEQKGIDPSEAVVELERGVAQGYAVAREVIDQEEGPLSFFANDDQSALGVMRAAFDLGRTVPGDVAILGCDNLEIGAYTTPRLSTVVQPRFEIGVRGAQLLLESIADHSKESSSDQDKETPKSEQQVTFMPSLLLRESTDYEMRNIPS